MQTNPTNQATKAIAGLLKQLGVSQRVFARACGLSKTTAGRVCQGHWPQAQAVRPTVEQFLRKCGASAQEATAAVYAAVEDGGGTGEPEKHARAVPSNFKKPTEEETMLLVNETLRPATLAHFGLVRSPFLDDVQGREDVYHTQSVRFVRACLWDAAQNHGFIAVVGESGAGKSTLAEELEERIKAEGRDVTVIRPYVLGMEESDTKGKTLKSGAIAAAIVRALDPTASVCQTPQARFEQVHRLLKASFSAGRKHLLLIEEAHGLPTATLKHLKRFLELKDGMRRLMGIALIGQPELRTRLAGQNAELREVTQRCGLVELEPLDNELAGYIKHKLARAGVKMEDVVEPNAVDALRARLTYTPRGARASEVRSLCYPLMVNNLLARAMNQTAATGFALVNAAVVESI